MFIRSQIQVEKVDLAYYVCSELWGGVVNERYDQIWLSTTDYGKSR
jgi:hypothetical protein